MLRGGKAVGVITVGGAGEEYTQAVNAVVVQVTLAGWGVELGGRGSTVVARPSPPPPVAEICRFGEERTFEGIEFIRVCAGEFTMGSADNDPEAEGFDDEKPAHRVTLSEFWIGKYEISNEQYRRFRTAHEGDADLPATRVSWNDANVFCEFFGFRLPTEAEWEYAARAGTQTAWSFGDDESEIGRYAWYSENSQGRIHPVGTRDPNGWGLHDMHGNVWEWVADWYGPYSKEPQADPKGPSRGEGRVIRGSNHQFAPGGLRSAARNQAPPWGWAYATGFRCARSPRRQP